MEALRANKANDEALINESFGYIESVGGIQLKMVCWIPEKMSYLVVLIHGLGEHILRYRPWAGKFNDEGIGVIGIDLRGHGESGGQRGHGSIDEFTSDIHNLLTYAHRQYPFIPKILYGHSMGGNLVLKYTIDCKPNISGVISTSPWLRLFSPPAGFVLKLAEFMKRFSPRIPLSNRVFAKYISHDPAEVKLYQHDPLIHPRITPKLFFSINESGEFILQNKHKINLPLLLMHGTGDKITSCRATTEFENYTSDKTTLKLWKGAYHELHHEIEKDEVFRYILHWIEGLSSAEQ
ncbi:MAG TPA: alpha/beta hydrolase [Bacteroidales bacterium]|nr:alpha/beta hydrolase [Bacteroidales bacterium]